MCEGFLFLYICIAINGDLTTKYQRHRRGRHCMIVGFTITYAISAYHH